MSAFTVQLQAEECPGQSVLKGRRLADSHQTGLKVNYATEAAFFLSFH